jgi:hypothetical protein
VPLKVLKTKESIMAFPQNPPKKKTRKIPGKREEFEPFFNAVNTFLAFEAMRINGYLAGDAIWFKCPFCQKFTPIPASGFWKNEFHCGWRRKSIIDLAYFYTEHKTLRDAVLYLDKVAIGPLWNIPPEFRR